MPGFFIPFRPPNYYENKKRIEPKKHIPKKVYHSFEKHINSRVFSDVKLANFFKVLAENGKGIEESDRKDILEEIQGMAEEYFEAEKYASKKLEEVEKVGVNLSGNIRTKSSYAPVSVNVENGARRN